MTEQTGFTLSVSQNKYLSPQTHAMNAVISVTAAGLDDGPGGDPPQAAEVLLIDCSGSMDMPHAKIIAARQATRSAIDALRDGVLFAVVAGTERAEVVYPLTKGLVAAHQRTRAEARLAVTDLVANGGTAIGTWLRLAHELLSQHPNAVRHAMLFTDGRNEHESPEELTRVLDQVRGRFVCDVRGIGDAWEPKELKRIVAVLNGQARGVAEFADMDEDFRALMRAAMRKVVPDVDLKLRMVGGARLKYLKQVYPSMVDVTDQLVPLDELTVRLPTGAWADETREYQLCVEVDATGKPMGRDALVTRVDLDFRGDAGKHVSPGLVLVHWTDEPLQVTRLDPKVAHYTGQQELGDAVNEGCEAVVRDDRETAEEKFGLAVQRAIKHGNQAVLALLGRLLDIVDGPAGKVRLKSEIRITDLKGLELSSNWSSRTEARPEPVASPGPPRICPACEFKNDSDALLCEQCGYKFDTEQPS